jgi:hypothetical protein
MTWRSARLLARKGTDPQRRTATIALAIRRPNPSDLP